MGRTTERFYVVEGIDGAGKSTLVEGVAAWLRRAGHAVTTTREPGGTALAERIRSILKSTEPDASGPPDAEAILLLFEAARSENLGKVVSPALAAGHVVISDRFTASTRVYQGRCLGDEGELDALHGLLRRPRPRITFLVDLPAETAIERLTGSRGEKGGASALASLEAKRDAYAALADGDEAWVTLDGTTSSEALVDRMSGIIAGDMEGSQGRGESDERA